jgi:hypothetical protein
MFNALTFIRGCYTDDVGLRTLPDRVFPQGDLTTELCTSACKAAGFIYAGTEYGGECYCGNTFQNGGGPASDGDAQCNMNCNGYAEVSFPVPLGFYILSNWVRKFAVGPTG